MRGRNGPFIYHHHYSEVWEGGAAPSAYVEIYSNSPHTQTAPVTFSGPPKELIKLFRRLASELAAGKRAPLAPNSQT
jgi:hypothetical protein